MGFDSQYVETAEKFRAFYFKLVPLPKGIVFISMILSRVRFFLVEVDLNVYFYLRCIQKRYSWEI